MFRRIPNPPEADRALPNFTRDPTSAQVHQGVPPLIGTSQASVPIDGPFQVRLLSQLKKTLCIARRIGVIAKQAERGVNASRQKRWQLYCLRNFGTHNRFSSHFQKKSTMMQRPAASRPGRLSQLSSL